LFEEQDTVTISHSFLLGMKNVSDKLCRENQNTFYIQFFFFFENRAVYKLMWKIMVEPDRPQMTIWRKRITC